ncbi:large conductance mechanosensitive channel protein MscL [Acetobacterium tundrae]|uniref:Large-conductance mechanosensitive channel n=1 Tax=Acetobacterium tundrae TaxID=132932 RepID=A0ABR6WIU0_9FIRM|nr:large conductance mechanosensitive channel protein MscL [Acetobacterium tundrae]MBC3796181.1 large conductance mechanosensitive channel protein MscL [Acetobacterium tundrae]
MKNFLKEFRTFALRGNVMDLAIAVIIGAAFQGVIKSLTDDIISPILGIFARTDFSNFVLPIFGVEIRYGSFFTAIINFVIMAFVIFFMIKVMNHLAGLRKTKKVTEVKTKTCPYCCTEIPVKAQRCPNCTTSLIRQ